jgi:hypothetical protein
VNGHSEMFNEIHRDLEPGEGLFDENVGVQRRARILGGWGKEDIRPVVGEQGWVEEEEKRKET